MKQAGIYLAVIFIALCSGWTAYQVKGQKQLPVQVLGSVQRGGEYHSTSTGAQYPTPAIYSFTAEAGTLGSVVITGANTGIIDFYDATTTNVNLRTGQKPTSTIRVASIPASLAAGTYTLDAVFVNGLIMVSSGNLPTSTITWR